jgi:pullulanase/glycogen debranching enzyme
VSGRRLLPGTPEPLGVTLLGGGANVAVFSAHATRIDLCLFDATGEREVERITLPERTGDVFHGFILGLEEGARYGLRAHGAHVRTRGTASTRPSCWWTRTRVPSTVVSGCIARSTDWTPAGAATTPTAPR